MLRKLQQGEILNIIIRFFFRFVTYVVTLGLTSGQEQILCGDLMFRLVLKINFLNF